jgi:hypothetical protein
MHLWHAHSRKERRRELIASASEGVGWKRANQRPFLYGTSFQLRRRVYRAIWKLNKGLAIFSAAVFLRMRSIVFLFVIAMPFLLLAEDSPLDSLPQAVRETIEAEKGDGVVKSAESYDWGNVTIFKIEIDVDGIPALELHIAGNGKLIRADDLRIEKDEENGE